MRDTAELGTLTKHATENYLPRPSRAHMFRRCAEVDSLGRSLCTGCLVASTAPVHCSPPGCAGAMRQAQSCELHSCMRKLPSMSKRTEACMPRLATSPCPLALHVDHHDLPPQLGLPHRHAAARRQPRVGQLHLGARRQRRHARGGRHVWVSCVSASANCALLLLIMRSRRW